MNIDRVLAFWLGSLDSRVASGAGAAGGTRDLRLCKRGDAVRAFIGTNQDPLDQSIHLEAYPEAGLEPYDLRVVEWTGQRAGELALPGQSAKSRGPYPLWKRYARAWTRGGPKDAVLLLRDGGGRFHARMVRREQLADLPGWLRTPLQQLDECARLISPGGSQVIVDLPGGGVAPDRDAFVVLPPSIPEQVAALRRLRGPGGREPAGQRYRRSRRLATTLKAMYAYQCQLCDGTIPPIPTRSGKFYVEVHHLDGLDETAHGLEQADPDEDLVLDSADHAIVVCAHHHRWLHSAYGGYRWDRTTKEFVVQGGPTLRLVTNHHL